MALFYDGLVLCEIKCKCDKCVSNVSESCVIDEGELLQVYVIV